MSSYKVTFTGPTRRVERVGKCPACNKRVVRARTFEMTVNPFNRNRDTGLPKTWDEVAADLDTAVAAWVPDFRHATCRI